MPNPGQITCLPLTIPPIIVLPYFPDEVLPPVGTTDYEHSGVELDALHHVPGEVQILPLIDLGLQQWKRVEVDDGLPSSQRPRHNKGQQPQGE